MKKIKEYRMSLMTKDSDKSKIAGKTNYIIKYSALLEVANYIKNQENVAQKEYDYFVLNSSKILFNELLKNKGKTNIDSVGIWVSFEDGLEIDNSIDISVLEDIKNYGSEDIEPIKEFFKMTLEETDDERLPNI